MLFLLCDEPLNDFFVGKQCGPLAPTERILQPLQGCLRLASGSFRSLDSLEVGVINFLNPHLIIVKYLHHIGVLEGLYLRDRLVSVLIDLVYRLDHAG